MALLASPNVGVRRHALLKDRPPRLRLARSSRMCCLSRRSPRAKADQSHARSQDRRTPCALSWRGSELTFVTTVISNTDPLFISERENGNLSYLDLEGAFPFVKYTNQKTESKNI